jgi:glycosyltransferase involved in cell wall biosynthesis
VYRARPRVNIDVAVTGDSDRRRWLRNSPDTYRVRELRHPSRNEPVAFHDTDPRPGLSDVVIEGEWHAHYLDTAERFLTDPSVDAVIIARTGFRRTAWIVEEPTVEPLAIAVRTSAWNEVGGSPRGSVQTALYERLRDAGHRFVLLPEPGEPRKAERTDRIGAPSVVVLSLVPLHDIGGGGRSARIALELVRRGFHVTFVSAHGSVGTDLGLRYIHPNLEQRWVWDFDPSELIDRVPTNDRILVLIEAPTAELITKIAPLEGAGYCAVYDIIDRWSDPSLGWDWYDEELERQLVESVDAVTASAPDLVPDTATGALVVPNAVDDSVFGVAETSAPDDFPTGEGPVIGYHGSLYGAWFDWDAIEAVALAYPSATVVMIGDGDDTGRGLPGNVRFLGPKAIHELPAYVQRFDVGLVPFTISAATHAVSPLKVFEYLASGVPVAAPPLRGLDGLEGVYTDPDLGAAVEAALSAPKPDRRDALGLHSWAARLGSMFAALDLKFPDVAGRDVAVVRRATSHYSRDERQVRGS